MNSLFVDGNHLLDEGIGGNRDNEDNASKGDQVSVNISIFLQVCMHFCRIPFPKNRPKHLSELT